MLDERWVILAAILNMGGTTSYVLATLKGRTQPNRVTWALWALLPMITFTAQIGEGVGWPALMTFTVGFGPLLVLGASFVNADAYWALGRRDLICGLLSVVAIVAWLVTRHGTAAILVAIVADFAAGLPTFVKAWRRPETEDPVVFGCAGTAAAVTLLTIDRWHVADAAFPAFILVTSVYLFVMVRYPSFGPGRTEQAPAADRRRAET